MSKCTFYIETELPRRLTGMGLTDFDLALIRDSLTAFEGKTLSSRGPLRILELTHCLGLMLEVEDENQT